MGLAVWHRWSRECNLKEYRKMLQLDAHRDMGMEMQGREPREGR